MPLRLILGLIGMLLACVGADINEEATSIALTDIRGVYGFSLDQGSWFTTLYATGVAMGMLVAPWLAATYSMRRFAVTAVLTLGALGLYCTFIESRSLLLPLRWLQGLTNGFLIPLLMAVALRFLTPATKLFGLAAYGLTATFAPNMATPIVAWANLGLGVEFVFWAVVPVSVLAAVLIAYGLPSPRSLAASLTGQAGYWAGVRASAWSCCLPRANGWIGLNPAGLLTGSGLCHAVAAVYPAQLRGHGAADPACAVQARQLQL